MPSPAPAKKRFVFPLHPFLLAAYAPLALYAVNANEVAVGVMLRPLLICLAAAGLLLLLGRLALRGWARGGLAASLLLGLFFTYGHLYNFLEATPALQPLARHRIIGPLYLLILVSGLAVLAWKLRRARRLTLILNAAAALLLIFPLAQSAVFAVSASRSAEQAAQSLRNLPPLTAPSGAKPSVYYIVLDTYMRSDALQRDLGFDNSAFVSQLEQMGFRVPACTHANYDYTLGSLTSTLNMDYLDALGSDMAAHRDAANVFALLKHSRVRDQLEALGYQTVAFDSGYEWSRLRDADVYLALGKDSLAVQSLHPFETLLVKSTALRLLTDYSIKAEQQDFNLPSSQFNDHINLERFILKALPGLAADPTPKFVFAHILIPHWPYVFLPDGSIRDDPAYAAEKLPPALRNPGYLDSVRFINTSMIAVLKRILAESKTPPVIVLMGDHGLADDNRIQNFAAIYLPGDAKKALYPGISPVNYFRVAFNTVFAARYPLLDDISWRDIAPQGQPAVYRSFPETAPQCLP